MPPGSGLYGCCPCRPGVGPPLSVAFSVLRRSTTMLLLLLLLLTLLMAPDGGDGTANSVPLPPYLLFVPVLMLLLLTGLP